MKPDGSDLRAVTRVNAEKAGGGAHGRTSSSSPSRVPDGDLVYGYIVKPVDFDPAKKYPVAFLIHGGPQGSFGNTSTTGGTRRPTPARGTRS